MNKLYMLIKGHKIFEEFINFVLKKVGHHLR